MEIFVDWINHYRGGVRIHGRWHYLNLVMFDDRSDAAVAEKATAYAIDHLDFNLFIGPYGNSLNEAVAKAVSRQNSKDALAILPTSSLGSVFENRSKVIGLSPDARKWTQYIFAAIALAFTDQTIITFFSNYFGNTINTDQTNTNPSSMTIRYAYIVQTDDGESVAACGNASYYAESSGKTFERVGYRNITRASTDVERSAITDWFMDLSSTDNYAHIVFICAETQVCQSMTKSFSDLNYNPPGLALSQECIRQINVNSADGAFIMGITPWIPEKGTVSDLYHGPTPWTSETFNSNYTTKFARHLTDFKWEADHWSAAAFASLEVLVLSIEATNSLDPSTLREHIKKTSFNTVYGVVQQDATSHSNASYEIVQQQESGKYQPMSVGDFIFPLPAWSDRSCNMMAPEYSIYGFPADDRTKKISTDNTLTKEGLMEAARHAAYVLDADPNAKAIQANESWNTLKLSGAIENFAKDPIQCDATYPVAIYPYCYRDLLHNLTKIMFEASSAQLQVIARWAMHSYLRAPLNRRICGPCPLKYEAKFEGRRRGVLHAPGERKCHTCAPSERIVDYQGRFYQRQCQNVCPMGQGKDILSQNCYACPAGKKAVSSECIDCTPGRYSSVSESTDCTYCPVGAYAASSNQTACVECAPGYDAQSQGSASCSNCTQGRYAAIPGQSLCKLCLAGRIASEKQMTRCDSCPAGTSSVHEQKLCAPCEVGKYQNIANQSQCKNWAKRGAIFPQKGMVKGNNTAQYWTYQNGDALRWEFCRMVPDGCLVDERCAEGSTGVQCSACLPDYFPPSFTTTNSCEACPSYIMNLIFTILAFVVILFTALVFARMSVASIVRPTDIHVPLMKILIHYGFMCGIFARIMRRLVFSKREDLSETTSSMLIAGCWLFIEGLMGKPTLETGLWSVNCLLQPQKNHLAAQISQLKHSDWHDPAHQAVIRKLTNMHDQTETDMVIFWIFTPFIVMGFFYLVSLLGLILWFLRHSSILSEANQFYLDLLKEGAAYVKQNYEEASLQPYFDLYKKRVLGLWWPFNYISAAHRQGCCYRRRVFGGETMPVILATILLIYGMVVTSIMRPFDCYKFSDSSVERMVSATTIQCDDHDEHSDLFWWGWIGGVTWGIALPVAMFLLIWMKKSKLLAEEWWKQENCVLLIGYNGKCAWWEAVVFLDKFALCYFAHLQHSVRYLILYQFLLSLAYGAANVAFRPYDKRCHNILWKVKASFLCLRVFLCICLETLVMSDSDLGWLLAVALTAGANLLFGAFVTYQLVMHGATTLIQATGDQADRLSWLKVSKEVPKNPNFYQRVIGKIWGGIKARHQRNLEGHSYVCFDHLLGWVTLCGNRADLAYPPTIEKGHRSQNASGRPALSKAPDTPNQGNVKKASRVQRTWLSEVISESMLMLTTGRSSGTFSVSVLEFIMRSGMLFAFQFSGDERAHMEDKKT
jgi:ABC-type branched-subunit amino acid transport system substrate-binding protein